MKTAAPNVKSLLPFIPDNGEMAKLIISHDWSQSSLGHPEDWPQSLKTTLSILIHSKFPTVLFWGKDLVCFYNDAFRPSLGIEGKHPWSLGRKGEEMWAEIWPIIKPWLDQVLSGGESIWMENQLVPFYRNGRIEDIYWTFCYNAVFDESNKPAGVFVTCTETTQIILSEKKLKESELFARSIIMNSEAGQAVWAGNDMVFEMVNEKMLAYLGTEDNIIGKTLLSVVPQVQDNHLLQQLRGVLATGKTLNKHEERFTILRDGDQLEGYYNFTYKALRNAEGKNYAILCTAIDVTEEVLSRKRLEESEQNFRNLVLQAPMGICIVKAGSLEVEVVNNLFLELVGRTREEMEHHSYWKVIWEAQEYYAPILQKVFDTGVSYTGNEHKVSLVRNGLKEIVYISFVMEPVKNEKGDIERVMIVGVDVTPQVLSRIEIEKAQAREKLAISASQMGVFEVDLVRNEVIASPRLEEIFGIEHSTDRNRFVDIIHPDDLPHRQEAYDVAYKTGTLRYEGRIMRKDGATRWMRSSGTVIFDEEGKPQKLIGVTQDITEEKQFEDELNKQVLQRTTELQNKNAELEQSNQKLEEFAHAASHDLKEPMRKIHFFIDRLKMQLSDRLTEEENLTLSRIEGSTKRMISLVNDLLQYSHLTNTPLEKEVVNLNKKLELVIEDLDVHIQEKKALIDVQPLPTIKGYRRQLQQLFQNLISNALKYAKPDSVPQVAITSRRVKVEEFNTLFPEKKTSDYYLIEVADNGIGFDQRHAEQIFKIFYRLHERHLYGGTGVGLAIARKVVENHDGKIVAVGQPGKGATFQIYLPANDSDSSAGAG